MSALWVGIDLGTQSVKVSVVDENGRVFASSSAALTSMKAGNRHEQDPLQWVGQAQQATATAVALLSAVDLARVAGVAICATSGTITTVDLAGRPVSTGIMYDDSRAGDLSTEVANADPILWKRLGYRIQATWALPKILWLARNNLLRSGAKIAHQVDVVAAAITGGPVETDWSHSLKSGYDLQNLCWPSAALESLGIDPRLLPNVVAPGTPIGTSCAAWEQATGLPSGTALFAGMTDGCAAQLGAGTLGLGDWHSVIGTTLVVKTVSSSIVVDDTGAVYSHRAPHEGFWFPGGASNVGAGALSELLPHIDLGKTTAEIAARYDGRFTDIPTSYPLTATGERFPIIQPDAVGFIRTPNGESALRDAARKGDPEEILAAILLGVACVERLSIETMTAAGSPVTGTVSSSGGGTKNSWWTQLRADLLGRVISVPISAEGSIGMAILAAWAGGGSHLGGLPDLATRMSPVGTTIYPNVGPQEQLEQCYRTFRDNLVHKGWLIQ